MIPLYSHLDLLRVLYGYIIVTHSGSHCSAMPRFAMLCIQPILTNLNVTRLESLE